MDFIVRGKFKGGTVTNVETGQSVSMAGYWGSLDYYVAQGGDTTLSGSNLDEAFVYSLKVGSSVGYRFTGITRFELKGGNDILDLTNIAQPYTLNVFVDAGSGNDVVWSGHGNDTILGGNGTDSIDGGLGDDWIWSANGNDTIVGRDGADVLLAGNGEDLIEGGAGVDVIEGGLGGDTIWGATASGGDAAPDQLFGGFGADRFNFRGVFGNEATTAIGAETIYDFQQGVDTIALYQYASGGGPLDFATLQGLISDAGFAFVLIDLSSVGGSNLLVNGSVADFDASDFAFVA